MKSGDEFFQYNKLTTSIRLDFSLRITTCADAFSGLKQMKRAVHYRASRMASLKTL